MYNPSHSFDFLKSWFSLWAQSWKVLDTPQSGKQNQNQTFLLVWVVFHFPEQKPFLLSSCPFSTSLIKEQRNGSDLFPILPPPFPAGAAELKLWEKLSVVCMVHFLWVRRRPWGRLGLGGLQPLSQLLLSSHQASRWSIPKMSLNPDFQTLSISLTTSKRKSPAWKLVSGISLIRPFKFLLQK